MPINPPALDDRSFDDLVADLVRRIPAHTPEWTDPREGDPGRTMIDLFAWLGDTILYRANLIPERQRLAFLRLLGQGMRPATPASGIVQVSLTDPNAASLTLPVRHPISKPVPFETLEELTVHPVEARCFLKRKPTAEEVDQFQSLLPDLQELYGLASAPTPYVTTPIFLNGAAELGGRDPVAESVDKCIWVALLAPLPGDVAIAAARKALGGGESGQRTAITMGLAPLIDIPQALEAIGKRAPIAHVWEICTSDPTGTSYLPLDVLAERTDGLTRQGTIRLLLPGADDFGAPSNDVIERMDAGVGDAPPRIDDARVAARLVTWLRLRPTAPLQPGTLRLMWVGANAVRVEARRTVGRQQIGKGTGMSGQALAIGLEAVEPASLVVEVEEEEGMRAWRQLPDVQLAGRGDRAYSLDPEAGVIRFGDGMRGAVPAIGRAIHVATARTGGGVAGNVPAGAITAIDPPAGSAAKLQLAQPLAMSGGTDSETLADAEARIPATIRHGDRGVTSADLRELAQRTPGVSVGRVEVLERFKPQQRRFDIPGVVSVMVIPSKAGLLAPAPRADRATLETVYDWLDTRRPLTAELYVIAPDYVPVGVSAAVDLIDPGERDAVLAMVQDVIRLHLWPLAPGGSDGQGWTLGRALDDRLLETAIARVPGIRAVAPVRLFRKSTNGQRWNPVAEDGTGRGRIILQPWQLPELAMLSVGVGDTAASSLGSVSGGAGGGGAGAGGVSIPVVPEVC
jgi:hypothetical protein